MKKTYLSRGFTLIELLVVIAIIGILSSVVLASLNTARAKGADSAIKADLAGVRSTAEIEYDNLGQKYSSTGTAITGADCATLTTANTIFANTNIQAALQHAKNTAGGSTALVCNINAGGTAYAIAAPLKTASTFWCIDSVGAAKGTQGSGTTQYSGLVGASTAALDSSADMTCN